MAMPVEDAVAGAHEPDALSEDEYHGYGAHGDRSYVAEALQSVAEEELMSTLHHHLRPPYIVDESSHPSSQESIDAFIRNKPELRIFYHEKWHVDVDSVEYLASVMRATKAAPTEEQRYGIGIGIDTSFKALKLEEPLLHTHPPSDMAHIRRRNAVELHTEDIAPFKIDDEQDEGIAWRASNLNLPALVNDELRNEKWPIDHDTVGFIKHVFSTLDSHLQPWLAEDRKRRLLPKLSSPLLPLSPPLSPERLPSPIAEVELTSTPEDPSVAEAAILDARLAERDMLDAESTTAMDLTDLKGFLDATTTGSSSPLQRKAKRLQDLKLSDPLLPDTSSEPPTKKTKTVSFTEELHTLIPRLPSDESVGEPSTDEAMAIMTDVLAPFAKTGIDRLRKEQLTEVDTTLRVPVPKIEDVSLTAPWEIYAQRQQDLMVDVFNKIIKTNGKWSGVSKLEKTLPWSPFPSYLAKLKPEGDFDDGSCVRYLADINFDGEVDFANLTWKLEGLRVLEEDDDDQDEELEACHFSGDEMIDTDAHQISGQVVQSRATQNRNTLHPGRGALRTQLRLDDAATGGGVSQVSSFSQLNPESQRADNGASCKPSEARHVLPSMEELIKRRAAQLESGKQKHEQLVAIAEKAAKEDGKDTGSVPQQPKRLIRQHQGLDQFMALQNQQAIDNSAPFSESVVESINAPEVFKDPQLPAPALPTETLQQPESAFPTPVISQKQMSATIITSPSFDRRLAAKLISYCPNLQEITRPPISNQTETEAHLTLSPSTGLHITNLQKIAQKPLPGREHEFQPFLSRIQNISLRYSTLIVLVNGPIHSIAALNTLTSQTTTSSIPNCEIRTIYIPSEHEIDLVRWIAACIEGHCSAEAKILEEETFWERFLRTAGFNAFAAQAILDALKPGDLASFVLMSEEERVRRFGALLGGETALRRASQAIDARWESIASA